MVEYNLCLGRDTLSNLSIVVDSTTPAVMEDPVQCH
jgi:hypothetical protein